MKIRKIGYNKKSEIEVRTGNELLPLQRSFNKFKPKKY